MISDSNPPDLRFSFLATATGRLFSLRAGLGGVPGDITGGAPGDVSEGASCDRGFGRAAGRGSWTGTPEVPGSRRNCGAMRGAGDPGGDALMDEPGAASGDIGGGAMVAGFQRVPY